MDESKATQPVSPETEQAMAQRAKDRAMEARWDLNLALFLFVVLITVNVLLFRGVGVELVALVAVLGLAIVWLMGWRRGKGLYQRFYDEELRALEHEAKIRKAVKETVEETIEEKVQKALKARWQ